MRGWWIFGAISTAAAWVLLFVVQAVAGQPLPPPVSISQYGVGAHGWIFSLWMLTVGAAPCLLYCYRPVRGQGARWWLAVGLAGAAVMATVRTDPGGLQQSVNAKIHMGGATLALAGLPLGMMFTLLGAARPWPRIGLSLVGVSAVSMGLLLLSANGVDTTGMGDAWSWSFWQSVAVAVDLILLVAMVFGSRTIRPVATDPEPWWVGAAICKVNAAGPHRPRPLHLHGPGRSDPASGAPGGP